MHVQARAIWLTLAVAASALGGSLFLRVVPAQPSSATQTAQRFVGFLQSRELEKAYQLTIQKDEVGESLGAFQRIFYQQWAEKPMGSIQCLSVSPFQSYGNRLRRWLHGREVEMQELRIEFSIDGVPVDVRERPVGNGEWKVCCFQVHAG